jgi:hypothetical protein
MNERVLNRRNEDKIVYVFLDYFPPGYVENGWKADE